MVWKCKQLMVISIMPDLGDCGKKLIKLYGMLGINIREQLKKK